MTEHKKHSHDEQPEGDQERSSPQAQPLTEAPSTDEPVEADAASEAARLKAERDDYLLRLQRVSADFMNYQKRVQREIADAKDYANADLLKDILPALDDLERGMKAAQDRHDDPMVQGVKMVTDKMMQTLCKYGLCPIQSKGQPFQPGIHQAVMQQASGDVPPGTVLEELQKGYTLRGRTLRPATVVVSKTEE